MYKPRSFPLERNWLLPRSLLLSRMLLRMQSASQIYVPPRSGQVHDVIPPLISSTIHTKDSHGPTALRFMKLDARLDRLPPTNARFILAIFYPPLK